MSKTEPGRNVLMAITHEPPQTFANQQLGKRHGFLVAVKVSGHDLSSSAILKVELLYADDLSPVPDLSNRCKRQPHKILQVLQPIILTL